MSPRRPDDYDVDDLKAAFGAEFEPQNPDYYDEAGKPLWRKETVIAFTEAIALRAAAAGEWPFNEGASHAKP